jgi:hypothetical protein
MLWLGVYPQPFLERMEVSLETLIESVERRSARPAGIGQLELMTMPVVTASPAPGTSD